MLGHNCDVKVHVLYKYTCHNFLISFLYLRDLFVSSYQSLLIIKYDNDVNNTTWCLQHTYVCTLQLIFAQYCFRLPGLCVCVCVCVAICNLVILNYFFHIQDIQTCFHHPITESFMIIITMYFYNSDLTSKAIQRHYALKLFMLSFKMEMRISFGCLMTTCWDLCQQLNTVLFQPKKWFNSTKKTKRIHSS